ncbi:PREDICTED: leukocyte cysteine proteinase inhibitor 1-like [Nanorana parkeri]|uniref:leukocyte cysteine proteinase inhibitor 1-like n=1 Tax=Nanorana parkeri TaxID=125878 RepID=UPI0008540010|nr:PREDICTED: leukocyte cysteine proteinase inhibitor 1-like [Nanorana parkeri]
MSHCSEDDPGLKAVGGFSEPRAPSKEDQAVTDKVKGEFIKKTGQNTSEFKAVLLCTQVVAGTNYIVKVKIGGDKYVHLKVFEPLPHTNEGPSLVSYQLNKKKDDKLEIF